MEAYVVKVFKNIMGYSMGILLLASVMVLPVLGLLWFSGIQYRSVGALLTYLALIMLLSFPIEALEKFVTSSIGAGMNLSKQNITRLDRTLDFLTSLWIIHFVDEWMKQVNISTTGELIFSALLILFTIILEQKNKELDEALNE